VLDDVAVLSKVAAKKTAGVLGDDLALNAQQVTGVCRPTASCRWSGRWPRARCSTRPSWCRRRWLISAFAPWLVTPLLMVGGAFLCFEGVEKLAHKLLHSAKRRTKPTPGR
jgi:predicted DNA repair protein MutK